MRRASKFFFAVILSLSFFVNEDAFAQMDLHNAAKKDNYKKAKRLISQGANVNEVSPSGYTPLHISAGLDKRRVTSILVSNGADLNASDFSGMTPLHIAAGRGHFKMVKYLLVHGADPSVEDNSGWNPADFAREKSHDQVAELLETTPPKSGSITSFFSSLSKESWYVIVGGISLLVLGSQLFS